MFSMELKRILQTSLCSPSLWECLGMNNEAVYIRYQKGQLNIEMSDSRRSHLDEICNVKSIYSKQIGSALPNQIRLAEVMKIIEEEGL